MRALAAIRLGRADEAETSLRDMLAAGAAMSAQDHLMFGMIVLARGDRALAAREFETALARLPTSAFQLAAARAYFDNGDVKEGTAALERAIATDPACAEFAARSPVLGVDKQKAR